MSLPRRDILPVEPARRRVAQPLQPPHPQIDGSQLVQRLSVQAGNMAGDLQHDVRALMVRASSPMPVLDGRDEVSSLRKQLRAISNKLTENCRPCLRTKLWRSRLSRVNGRWLVKKHMPLIARTRAVRATLYVQIVQRISDSLQSI